jgi:predicted MFS family arabinose efflux permease
MTELWQGWLGLGLLVGLGAAATGMTPATGLISRWFERNLAFAISFAYSGFAFGAVLLAPLAGQMIEAEGWRWTYQVFGLALIGLAAVVLILPWRRIGQGIKPSPPRRSLIPDRRVLSEVPFWGLFTIFFMTSVATYVVQVPSVVYLEEAGYSTFTATLVYGVNSMMSVVGILCAGWLSDRFGPRAIASLGYSLSIIGIIALAALAAGPNPVLLGLFLFCFGGAMGSRGPIVSSVTARLFEGQVGAVFGLITIGLGLGGAFGAWISGWLFEQTGGYLAGFGVAGAASLIGMAIFWVIPEVGQGRRRLA